MTVPDSTLAASFVAAPDHWSRNGAEPRAVVMHHAEGGGTVVWLTRNDGNSSHYVVEYSGRIVQMVAESEAAGSMNPRITRTTDDAPYTFEGERVVYGRTALNRAGIADDPNRYAIAVEVEGFAADGPNAIQRHALKLLVADIRRRRGPLPVLGHRDQQDQKACPGHRFPWGDYGGHGVVPTTGEDMLPITDSTPVEITVAKGTAWHDLNGTTVLATASADLDWRPSPFACGAQRAMYATVAGVRRLVLVVPSGTRPLPDDYAEGFADAKAKALTAVGAI